MNKLLSAIYTMVLIIYTNSSMASVIRVPTDYPTIQAGIDAARDEDTILVADGIYTGEGNRDISFRNKSITLKSENGAARCIIDCQGSQEEKHRGFIFSDDFFRIYPTLDGFTIKNGYHDQGGGIYIRGNYIRLTIRNCIIMNNKAQGGGGVYVYLSWSSKITNCIFAYNEANYGSAVHGMIFTTFYCTNCIFVFNTSRYGGPFCTYWGGDIINSIIWYNSPNDSDDESVTYSNVQGGHPGIGNINKDPLFFDAEHLDFHLFSDSPCIDAGIDYYDPDFDFNDNPRPQGNAIDMGIYEFSGYSALSRVHITMPSHEFFAEETVSCFAIVWNTANDTPPDTKLFVILDLLGHLYFAPSFTDFDYISRSFKNGRTDIIIIPEFTRGYSDDLEFIDATWYAALTNPAATELWSEVGVFEFFWH